MKRRLICLCSLLLLMTLPAVSQKEVRQEVRKANKLFQKSDYSKAEIAYRKALELNPADKVAQYNLANTLLRTERAEEAGKIYEALLKEKASLSDAEAADVAHNAGNLMMAQKQYAEAIECYKESLRKRPADEETRYNLALAKKLLEKEQQEGGGSQDQENQEEQEQEQQQEEQQQNEKQPPKDPKEDNEKENREQEQNQPEREQMSKDNAEKILEAYLQDEKETQKKVEQIKQQQQQKQRHKKNW